MLYTTIKNSLNTKKSEWTSAEAEHSQDVHLCLALHWYTPWLWRAV